MRGVCQTRSFSVLELEKNEVAGTMTHLMLISFGHHDDLWKPSERVSKGRTAAGATHRRTGPDPIAVASGRGRSVRPLEPNAFGSKGRTGVGATHRSTGARPEGRMGRLLEAPERVSKGRMVGGGVPDRQNARIETRARARVALGRAKKECGKKRGMWGGDGRTER